MTTMLSTWVICGLCTYDYYAVYMGLLWALHLWPLCCLRGYSVGCTPVALEVYLWACVDFTCVIPFLFYITFYTAIEGFIIRLLLICICRC